MIITASLMDVKEHRGFYWNKRLYIKIADCPYGCMVSSGCIEKERMFLSGLARVRTSSISLKEGYYHHESR